MAEALGTDGEVAASAVVEKLDLSTAVFIERHIGIPVKRATIIARQVLHRHARVIGMHKILAIAVTLYLGLALAHHYGKFWHESAVGRRNEH